jgi:hypothetical protein
VACAWPKPIEAALAAMIARATNRKVVSQTIEVTALIVILLVIEIFAEIRPHEVRNPDCDTHRRHDSESRVGMNRFDNAF